MQNEEKRRLGRDATPREDHAQYIDGWIGLMEDDKKAVVQAASNTQAACDWLFGERSDEDVRSATEVS